MITPPRSFFQRFSLKRKIWGLLCWWTLLVPAPGIDAPAPEQPRVLLLNSYHQGYRWSDAMLRGVLSEFRKNFSGLAPYVESMDYKRNPGDDQADAFLQFVLRKYRNVQFDLIITLDDAALDFALKHRDKLAPAAPIVFGGVNHAENAAIARSSRLTGVSEIKDFAANLELLLRLRPETHTVYLVRDGTETSDAAYAAFQKIAPQFADRLRFEVWQDWTADDLLKRAANLPPTDAILMMSYALDSTGRIVSEDIDFNRALTAQSTVPIILTGEPIPAPNLSLDLDNAVWQGIGGYLLSGTHHGQAVGKIAIRILRGEDVANIPILTTSPARLAFDYPQLLQHDIRLDRLPPGAEIFNHPLNFFQVYRKLILGAVAAFVGLVTFIVILLINNLHRRRAETALRRSNERIELLLTAVDQATELIALLQADGTIFYANPVLLRILQPAGQAPLKNCDILWRDQASAPIPFAAIAAAAITDGRWSQRVTIDHADHSTNLLEVIVTPIQTDPTQLPRFLVIAQDVTQGARLEERIRLGQKMDAIGTLASGIAHDFNNILTSIVGNTELAILDLPPRHPTTPLLLDIRTAADRATRLVRQILTFSRHNAPRREILSLTHTIKETLNFLRATTPAAITLRHTHVTSPHIEADPTQIYQVILNLCTNAAHAIGPRPGLIEVIEELIEVTPEDVATHTDLTPGPHLRLTVRDDGEGMPPEIARRVFEPFFTTKGPSQGTGLGLAVVHGILKNHHATITATSTPGKGTTFQLYFPAVKSPAATPATPRPEASTLPPLPRGQGQHIVVLDDEEPVLRVATKTLEGLGYHVTAFAQPVAALDYLRRTSVDALITDFSMPEMSALDLVAQVRTFAPQLPIILVSGYLSDANRALAQQLGITQIINKPHSRAALASALAQFFIPTPPSK